MKKPIHRGGLAFCLAPTKYVDRYEERGVMDLYGFIIGVTFFIIARAAIR